MYTYFPRTSARVTAYSERPRFVTRWRRLPGKRTSKTTRPRRDKSRHSPPPPVRYYDSYYYHYYQYYCYTDVVFSVRFFRPKSLCPLFSCRAPSAGCAGKRIALDLFSKQITPPPPHRLRLETNDRTVRRDGNLPGRDNIRRTRWELSGVKTVIRVGFTTRRLAAFPRAAAPLNFGARPTSPPNSDN